MGNCAASTQERGSKSSTAPSVAVRVVKGGAGWERPSNLQDSAFVGGRTPLKRTYLDFFWYLTAYHMANRRSLRKQQKRLNPFKEDDGKIHGTVDAVSVAVNAAEAFEGSDVRLYETQCHSPLWRASLKSWLRTQGVVLTFDYEPQCEIEAQAHANLGLFLKGYAFTAYYCDEGVSSFSGTSSCSSSQGGVCQGSLSLGKNSMLSTSNRSGA